VLSYGGKISGDLTIRPATAGDHHAIIDLVRLAFTNRGHDGNEELKIVADTRRSGRTLEGLELVATRQEVVIGHVLAAYGDLGTREIIAVAPLAVALSHQREGIGSALMEHLLRSVEALNVPLVVLLGSPDYYGRFGFEPSGPLGITYRAVGQDNPNFLALRLAGYDTSFRGDFTYCWE
jgi:putative acetyltransferase